LAAATEVVVTAAEGWAVVDLSEAVSGTVAQVTVAVVSGAADTAAEARASATRAAAATLAEALADEARTAARMEFAATEAKEVAPR